jgi:hypothetical protein
MPSDRNNYKRISFSRTKFKDSGLKWLEETYGTPMPYFSNKVHSTDSHEEADDELDAHAEAPPTEEKITTVMLCDIPCRQTIEQVVAVLNVVCFANSYNLVYMPCNRPKYSQKINMGYAREPQKHLN